MPRQCGIQHVLHQRALARAGDAGHRDQVQQREFDRDVLQVVFGRAVEDQLRRRRPDQPLDAAHADLLAPAEVGAGQRIGLADLRRRAVEDDLAAAFAGARSHVDQPVGGQHHRRVVLDDDQRIAGIAQPVDRLDDAVHVARVQADARFVEHEHRIDQRGAERSRQVDPLHLAAAQRAALPVERQVAEADIAQVAQPGADLVGQQLQRAVRGHGAAASASARRVGSARCACGEAVNRRSKYERKRCDRHQHQVVHGQAGQRLELLAGPSDAGRHRALRRRQHRIGIGLAADAPQQRLGLQPRALAGRAGGIAAVLRQQHPDVHLVRLRFEIFEEALDAIPLLVPVAGPVRRAVDHPVLLRRRQLLPRRIARNAGIAGIFQQVVLALLPGRRLHRLDRAGAQGLALDRGSPARSRRRSRARSRGRSRRRPSPS